MKMYELLKDNPYFEYLDVKKKYDMRHLSRDECMAIFRKEKEAIAPYMNRYENQFVNIPNFDVRYIEMFDREDDIVVQEKIDGSNAHINVSDNGFTCYGNNYILNEHNHLQGFWYWCSKNYVSIPEKYYGLDIYGEWLVPHHCEYPASGYTDFYVFDVMEDGKYWSQDKVEELAKECNYSYAPVLYKGKFESWKHLVSFVGKTMLGGRKGEGIVVKNQSKLNSAKEQFYIKIVDVEFQETNKSRKEIKTVDMEKILKIEEDRLYAESIVTLPRVRKIVLKLIEANELPKDPGVMEEKALIGIVKSHVIRDCMKEEKEITDKLVGKFGKYCNDILVKMIPELIKNM